MNDPDNDLLDSELDRSLDGSDDSDRAAAGNDSDSDSDATVTVNLVDATVMSVTLDYAWLPVLKIITN